MDQNWKVFLLLSAFLALQTSTFAHPLDGSKETDVSTQSESTTPTKSSTPLESTTSTTATSVESSQLNSKESLIPDTPGVRQFKKDLISELVQSISGNELENGYYTAELPSSEVDLPCTTDRVRIEIISSSFPLPERFFHAPKRCSEEEA
ncbi:uncharacterized protein LOC129249267 [Anastrepha obliqua]|uniref:uncharacterized protein LOC129249267 n=1 Tax=Anastrepha obliqua TaxID=95512 RepID=UPI00240A0D0C|nr:uncharacterized protein LOC129249267 [Anastrepha obliqua]